MSTTNNTTTNQQGPDAPQASENKPDAEKLPTTTTTTVATEGGEQAIKQEVVPTVEPTPQSGTTVKAEMATETKPDTASIEETKPEAMEITSSEELKAEIASSSEVKTPNAGDATGEKKDGETQPRLRLNGAARKRFRWLIKEGYSREEAMSLAKEPLKIKAIREKKDFKADQKNLSGASKKRLKWLVTSGYTMAEALELAREPLNRSRTDGPSSEDSPTPKRMAVVTKDYPVTHLTKAQAEQVKSAILKQVVLQKDADFKPRFEDCEFVNGYLLVHCADSKTPTWLVGAVHKLELWEGASLKTLSEQNLLRLEVFVGRFADSHQDSNEDILDFVKCQNEGMKTSKWKIIRRKDIKQGKVVELTFTMSKASARILHNQDYKLNYKFEKVLISKKDRAGTGGGTRTTTASNTNQTSYNNVPPSNRNQSSTNRVPPRRGPREHKPSSSSSFVPIWDSNLPKGGNYMRAPPNSQKWSGAVQSRGNVGSSNRNNNSSLNDSNFRTGSAFGNSYSGGASSQSSSLHSLSLIDNLYDQLSRTITGSIGGNSSRQETGGNLDRNNRSQRGSEPYDPSDCFRESRSRDSFDRYGSRRGNNLSSNFNNASSGRATNGGSSSYNPYSRRNSNIREKGNIFTSSRFF